MTDEQKAKMTPEHRLIYDLCTLAESLIELVHKWEHMGDALSKICGYRFEGFSRLNDEGYEFLKKTKKDLEVIYS